jgi:PncC family amidohydrolase
MESLEERVKTVFTAKHLTIATAESCTGGLLAGRITEVSGSSAYFIGGVVSYSYAAKEALLGVEHETLLAEGAVSEAVARQMARGTRAQLQTDVAVSITGVAGPTGGTTEKPVGLTWIGLSDSSGERAVRFVWEGDRAANRTQSVEAALRMLIEWAEGADPQ